MKFIQQNRTTARFVYRKIRLQCGMPSKPTLLLVRFGDSEQPGVLTGNKQYSLAELQKQLANVISWTEEIPCWIWVAQSGSHPLVPKAINFVHRLDCASNLYTDGTDVDMDIAYSWIDAGLQRVCVGIGGVSHEVHRASVRSDVEDATNAVRYLLAAKKDRQAALRVEVCVPWSGETHQEMDAILSWANEAGVEQVQIIPPFDGSKLNSDLGDYSQYRHPIFQPSTNLRRFIHLLPHNKLQNIFRQEDALAIATDPLRVEISIERKLSFGSKVVEYPEF